MSSSMHVYMEFERILFWHVSFWWSFELPQMRPKWGCHSLILGFGEYHHWILQVKYSLATYFFFQLCFEIQNALEKVAVDTVSVEVNKMKYSPFSTCIVNIVLTMMSSFLIVVYWCKHLLLTASSFGSAEASTSTRKCELCAALRSISYLPTKYIQVHREIQISSQLEPRRKKTSRRAKQLNSAIPPARLNRWQKAIFCKEALSWSSRLSFVWLFGNALRMYDRRYNLCPKMFVE